MNVLLAKTLSEMGQRVLLIDADLRKPQMHHRLGMNNLTGLSNVLTDDGQRWQDAVQRVPGYENWSVITAGRRPPDPTRLLSSQRMHQLVAEITDSGDFDLVVFDTPPVLGLADAALPLQVREGAEIDIKYSGYLQRQQQQIDQVKRQGQRKLPEGINYDAIGTLSREAREKLSAVRPLTLGQASQIPGVSQADLTALLMWLELRQRRNATNSATSGADLAPTANSR